MQKIGTILIIFLGVCSCVSRYEVERDYKESLRAERSVTPNHTSMKQTVVLFLFDGLSNRNLERALKAGRAENLREYFLSNGGEIHQGHVTFPSLTYPSISSLLTGSPIDQEPINGNLMRSGSETINFQSPLSETTLNRLLEKKSIFTKLASQHQNSVSLSYYFHPGATVGYPTDLAAGLDYMSKDYAPVDDKLIESLNSLLTRVGPDQWPSFIFVHLVGVDALGHQYGPDSVQVQNYIAYLNIKLAPSLHLLKKAEELGKPVVTMLTADYGFVSYTRYFDVEKWLRKFAPEVKVLNETRHVTLFFPEGKKEETFKKIADRIQTKPAFELLAGKLGSEVRIEAPLFDAKIKYFPGECYDAHFKMSFEAEYHDEIARTTSEEDGDMIESNAQPATPTATTETPEKPVPPPKPETLAKAVSEPRCPDEFDHDNPIFYAPFFVSNLAHYFNAELTPDAVLVAGPGIAFQKGQRGGHGGFSTDEVLVPILLRGAKVEHEGIPFPTYDLLSLLTKQKK